MHTLGAVIFTVTYLGVALGEVPGLALDRTGIALLGAIAMVVTNVIGVEGAMGAIDVPTILLLYSLMVLSAQYRLGGFYTWAALRITRSVSSPRRFLLTLMLVSAGLSALLANDIVCLAFTPVLSVALLGAGLDPVPFLIGLAVSSNIGSAATIIGNPQNMLIGQVARLDFGHFLAWCAAPSAASLAAAYLIILLLSGRRLRAARPACVPKLGEHWPAFDRYQSGKGILLTALLIGLFLTRVPRELSSIAVAGMLLCSRRMQTREILGLVDWHLITLFLALFVVVGAFAGTGLPAALLGASARAGLDLTRPGALAFVSVGLSNMVSNVPAVMLLLGLLETADARLMYVLALSSTFAGNLITIGSIANLITIEQARGHGIEISFREHARIGVPVTLASLLILLGWVALLAG